MIKEIYIRDESDPNFKEGVIDHESKTEALISQIRVLLGTDKGDVLGDHSFGMNLEFLVFKTVRNQYDIKDMIDEQISNYVYIPDGMSVDVDVNFGKDGENHDYAVIDIAINGVKTIGFLVDNE